MKSQLDPSEYPPNPEPQTNFTLFDESPVSAFEWDDGWIANIAADSWRILGVSSVSVAVFFVSLLL